MLNNSTACEKKKEYNVIKLHLTTLECWLWKSIQKFLHKNEFFNKNFNKNFNKKIYIKMLFLSDFGDLVARFGFSVSYVS